MVVFMHPVWDQTKKPERNAVETLVQCGGPSFMMKALRQQKAEEAEAKQKAEEAKRKAAEAEQKAEEAEQKAAKAEQKAAKAERRAEEAERKAEEAERKAAEAPKPGNAAEARPVPGQPGPILTPAITTEPAALLPSHAPTQKTQRRPLEQGLLPERRSLRSQYNVFPFPVAAEYVSSGAFLEPVVSTDALREASQHGAEASQQPETPRRSRPTIVVCVQFGSTHTAGGTAAGDPSIEGDEEARSAYLGEMLYFAKPLSISVAAVTGRSQAGTCAAKNTFSAVLMPTRRASRIPKLNYVLALALPHSPHKELAEAVDASEAFDLAEMGKSGADVFVFAPSPFLDTKLTSGGREGRLPDCPVPGYIKLLIPDLSVQDKSIQRKLMVLLVDLSPGASFGTQPALPTPHPTRSLGFDWAALLRLEPKAYKAAAAEQAQQVLQHVLSLRDAS